MRVHRSHFFYAVSWAHKSRLNCVYPCNPAGPAFDSKHPHLPRNEDLRANIPLAVDVS